MVWFLPALGLLLSFAAVGWQARQLRVFKQHLLRCEIGAAGCQAPQRAWLAQQAPVLASQFRFDAESADLLARAEVLFSANETELPAKRAHLKQALHWTEQAILLRPRWPYAYAARLGVQLQLGDLDANSDASWRAAWRYGPNEKRVLQTLAEAVFVYRDAGRATPTPAEPILQALVRRDRPKLIELGTRFGARDMLCPPGAALADDPLCQPANRL
ncbi:hypothetical protein C7S18_14845 [Ahniella affigens]|uniref:Uncharacterized protein n=2 Tax=Ahniella affigens TaxID=2021234 RepID=A0A2P1PU66_9GAMM|nr:hypothetical protein C7S18_14845 [Ahniella affigens]